MNAIKDIFDHYDKVVYKDISIDRYSQDYLFNTLVDGKTIVYIACKEGKDDILSYFLDKNLNPKIESKVNNYEYESCLQVACRWGYLKVVELLLNRVRYGRDEIRKAIRCANSASIINILRKHKKKSIKCCF